VSSSGRCGAITACSSTIWGVTESSHCTRPPSSLGSTFFFKARVASMPVSPSRCGSRGRSIILGWCCFWSSSLFVIAFVSVCVPVDLSFICVPRVHLSFVCVPVDLLSCVHPLSSPVVGPGPGGAPVVRRFSKMVRVFLVCTTALSLLLDATLGLFV
jgi:hypothetical protein